MEVVQRLYGQLVDLVRAMTPRTRIAAAVVLCVVVGSLLYLAQRELVSESVYLLGGQNLSAEEITGMQGALGKAQLNDFVVEGNRIRIPTKKQALYLAALADGNALPQSLTDVFSEATEKTTWFTSRQQQIEQRRTSKKKGLSLILRSMSGVETAEVDFDKEEARGLKQQAVATALVAIKLRGGELLTEDRAACFQRMAAAALTMGPQDVTVVDKTNHLVYGGRNAAAISGGVDDPYRSLKRKYQADYEETVRRALAFIPGVTVSADVVLERELRREEKRVAYDPNASVAVRHNEEKTSSVNEGYDPQGRPIMVAQGSANQPANLHMRPKSSEEKSVVSEDVTPSQNETVTEIAGLTPKRVALSIGIPNSYFEEIWRQQQTPQPGESYPTAPSAELADIQTQEVQRIRQHVAGLIPDSVGQAGSGPLVTVTPFSHLSPTAPVEPAVATVVWAWLSTSWTTIGLVGLAVGSLLALWSLVRTVTRGRADFVAPPTEAMAQDFTEHAPSFAEPTRERPRATGGRSLREDLADLVREDPATAANILRTWIGNAN